MKTARPFLQGHHIVLLGDFNPKIFQPAWFGTEGLLQKAEADGANIDIIHPEVVIFRLDWLKLEVTRERFMAGTLQEAFYEPIRDLVLGTFRILRHTPLKKMGINMEAHFQVETKDIWNEAGHALAPKGYWTGLLENPGTRSLVVHGDRPEGLRGYVQVTFEPSFRVEPGQYAFFIKVNDHFEIMGTEPVSGSDEIMEILEKNWQASKARFELITDGLLARLLEKR